MKIFGYLNLNKIYYENKYYSFNVATGVLNTHHSYLLRLVTVY